ncbi:MAG: hypothetical protein AB8B84_10295 [Granulosicoccus sp.]
MAKQAMLIAVILFVIGQNTVQAEEELDLEFLEWLGQTAEVEELGVDVDKWLISKQQSAEAQEAAEKTQ